MLQKVAKRIEMQKDATIAKSSKRCKNIESNVKSCSKMVKIVKHWQKDLKSWLKMVKFEKDGYSNSKTDNSS